VRSDDHSAPDWQSAVTTGAYPLPLDGAAVEGAGEVVEEPGFLLFRCAGVDCAVPLTNLREVLPQTPAVLPLPHSPKWLFGVFALRATLVGLADPSPLLVGVDPDGSATPHAATLLAGTGDSVLAWSVESVGNTAPITPLLNEEADALANLDGARDVSAPVVARYAVGKIAPTPDRRYTVIDAETLLADMLRALEEKPGQR
jgi:chemotaxis signal transduction protein